MKQFKLKIVTPDGIRYDANAEELVVRTTTGDMGIMADHISTVAPLGMGRCTVVIDGEKRYGACIGGMVTVVSGAGTVVATTFEWADDIDTQRARLSEEKAREVLDDRAASYTAQRLAEARLKRALIRQNVAGMK